MDNYLQTQLDSLVDLYNIMKKKYRWKANDISLRFAAYLFCLRSKPFDESQYDEMLKYIKKNTGLFSSHRTQAFTLTALLITRFDDPKQAHSDLLDYESLMKNEGFKSSQYLSIAAYALLLTCPKNSTPQRVKKAFEIYKRMKENHYWLTSADDYPVAVLLSDSEDHLDKIEKEMESCYQQLNDAGLRKSNGLQFLSHLLTFSPEATERKVARCKETMNYLKQHKLGVSSTYYGAIGFLALLGEEADKAKEEVREAVDYLKNIKGFKWHNKDLNILIVASMISNKYMEDTKHQQMLETTLGISIQALIAAQTAALIAATSAAAAASAASASG
ncbi:MAG: DUF4003 domain-containing protein [Firmicutes bacterium]|nr:DUF4003 domain-containing protein [Bacillota bacterium]